MKLRKYVTCGLITGLIALSGCGKNGNTEAVTEGTTAATEAVTEAVTEAATEVSTEASTEAVTEAVTETVTEEDNSSEAGQLYEDFKAGTAKAVYRGTADYTSYLDTKSVLTKGEAYSINDIADAMKNADEYMELTLSGEPEYTMIDCGSDGIQELLVDAPFGTEFRLLMIIKEIDGQLVICYSQDAWSRCSVTVDNDGSIELFGSSGANVHSSEFANVDANGDYRFYYGVTETITLFGDFYAYKTGLDYIVISSEGIDPNRVGVREFYFEPDYETRAHYYNIVGVDEDYNAKTDIDDNEDAAVLKGRFEQEGITVYSSDEIEKMIEDHMK